MGALFVLECNIKVLSGTKCNVYTTTSEAGVSVTAEDSSLKYSVGGVTWPRAVTLCSRASAAVCLLKWDCVQGYKRRKARNEKRELCCPEMNAVKMKFNSSDTPSFSFYSNDIFYKYCSVWSTWCICCCIEVQIML